MIEFMEKNFLLTRSLVSTELKLHNFYFKGTDEKAPSVYIQSSVHADELQGYLVSLKLIEYFSKNPPKGSIMIVPQSNPYGINHKLGGYTYGRFDPVTGENWNRNYQDLSFLAKKVVTNNPKNSFQELRTLFKKELKSFSEKEITQGNIPYHKKIALEHQFLASQADIILDLHCDTTAIPYLFSMDSLVNSAFYLNIPYIIETKPGFFSTFEDAINYAWSQLMRNYNELHPDKKISCSGTEAFTLELGSQEKVNDDLADSQFLSILNYLGYKEVIEHAFFHLPLYNLSSLEDFIDIYSPQGGLILESVNLLDKVKEGDTLAKISNLNSLATIDNLENIIEESSTAVLSPLEGIVLTKLNSSAIHEGMSIMKIMANIKKVEL